MYTGDETVLDRVGRGIDELGDDVLALGQPHDARFLGGPEVFPSPAQRVLAAREQLVEILDELRAPTIAIEDGRVVMVRLRDRQHDLDPEAGGGNRQAVDERVVGRVVGAQQKLPLRAATGDEVELPRQHFAWAGHARRPSKLRAIRYGAKSQPARPSVRPTHG
jgi:hypothetical protein